MQWTEGVRRERKQATGGERVSPASALGAREGHSDTQQGSTPRTTPGTAEASNQGARAGARVNKVVGV